MDPLPTVTPGAVASPSVPPGWPARAGKRLFDVLGAGGLLLLASGPMLLLALLVAASGGRPVLFGHRRVGRHGREFRCWKFRTMVPDAEQVLQRLLASDPAARAEWEAHYKLKDDPRVSSLGAFLRRTSLDELPQLWNVLCGDMSLVGPRPVVADELRRYYGAQAAEYQSVRPGITGPWQVSGRSDLDYPQRVRLDSEYAREWTLIGDLRILLRTAVVLLYRRGAY